MSHPSKKKGYGFEHEVVTYLRSIGLVAERAWGSNGESLGYPMDVDVVINKGAANQLCIQCKRRATLSKVIQPPDLVDAQVVREDFGEALVIMRWKDFLERFKSALTPEELVKIGTGSIDKP